MQQERIGWLENHHQGSRLLTSARYNLEDTASLLAAVGLDKMADQIAKASEKIAKASELMDEGLRDYMSENLEDSQKHFHQIVELGFKVALDKMEQDS